MSSYYCEHCASGLHEPEPEEILEGGQNCKHCGSYNECPFPEEAKNELILSLIARVDNLENILLAAGLK